jgi:hypothetical protein
VCPTDPLVWVLRATPWKRSNPMRTETFLVAGAGIEDRLRTLRFEKLSW